MKIIQKKKLLLMQKSIKLYPYILRFLISHFTQRESSFKYIDDLDGKSVVIDKIFDFN